MQCPRDRTHLPVSAKLGVSSRAADTTDDSHVLFDIESGNSDAQFGVIKCTSVLHNPRDCRPIHDM